jgi:hypothetical protein
MTRIELRRGLPRSARSNSGNARALSPPTAVSAVGPGKRQLNTAVLRAALRCVVRSDRICVTEPKEADAAAPRHDHRQAGQLRRSPAWRMLQCRLLSIVKATNMLASELFRERLTDD